MNEDTAKLALDWIVGTINDRQKDAEKDAGDHKGDAFKSGMAQAYFEVMDIIRSRVKVAEDMSK
ncbi:MAG: hypothetical protein RRZ24_11300 [Clostridia bacterium]